MPVVARAYRANPGNVPTLPSEPGTSTQTGHRGGGWGAWGRSPASHPCARVTRARTLPILPVAVDSSGLCVLCGKARGQNDEYLIDDNGYGRRDPTAAGDTQITIARIPDLRSRALSAWLTRNADGASYRPNYEARRQSRRKIWKTHHHLGSAEGRA
jgi:hypothetical protein